MPRATLLQTYDAKIRTPAPVANYVFKIADLVRLGPREYQMTIAMTVKDVKVSGEYKARLKQELLGNPEILAMELTGHVDVKVESTLAFKWRQGDKGALVFDFVPLHNIEKKDDGKKLSRGPTSAFVMYSANIERFALDSAVLDKVTDAIKAVASKTDADNVRNAVNDIFKEAANKALKENAGDMNANLQRALMSSNEGDKIKVEDFMTKLAVNIILP